VKKEKPATFSAELSHFSIESRTLWGLKSFTLGAKAIHFRSQSRSYRGQKSFILGAKVCASNWSANIRLRRLKTLLEVESSLFWTVLNIVGASSVAGGGIKKLIKKMSFDNTLFQIAKR